MLARYWVTVKSSTSALLLSPVSDSIHFAFKVRRLYVRDLLLAHSSCWRNASLVDSRDDAATMLVDFS